MPKRMPTQMSQMSASRGLSPQSSESPSPDYLPPPSSSEDVSEEELISPLDDIDVQEFSQEETHIGSYEKILILGEGNFSYSYALFESFKPLSPALLIPTSLHLSSQIFANFVDEQEVLNE